MGRICVVDVEIVVDCLVTAMKKGRKGERYIVGGDNVSYKELVQTIMGVTGVHQRVLPLPMWEAQMLSSLLKLGRFSKKRNKISKLFNMTMFNVASRFLYFDSSKAQRELGMRHEPFEQSIRLYRERRMLT